MLNNQIPTKDINDPRLWLKYAKEDLEAAEVLFDQPRIAHRITCYQAQQCAEKALKAMLCTYSKPFDKIHGLWQLHRQLPESARNRLMLNEKTLFWLGSFATEKRYPGQYPEPTPKDAQRAVNFAKIVFNRVEQLTYPLLRENSRIGEPAKSKPGQTVERTKTPGRPFLPTVSR